MAGDLYKGMGIGLLLYFAAQFVAGFLGKALPALLIIVALYLIFIKK